MGCVESSAGKGERSGGRQGGDGRPGDGAGEQLPTSQPKTVDERLPFDNYRQLFNLKNSWKAVSRSMENTAKDCLYRFFVSHPEYRALHKNLAALSEDEMKDSAAFEETAMFLFSTLDEIMAFIDGKVDMAIAVLRNAGQEHYSTMPGFQSSYLKDMEQPFLDAVRETLGDRFNEGTEQNFRRIYEFMTSQILNYP